MATKTSAQRQAIKTPEAAFVHVLRKSSGSRRACPGEVFQAAQETLLGHTACTALRPGQVRVIVATFKAPFGPPLDDTDLVEVTLTLDAGAEDVVGVDRTHQRHRATLRTCRQLADQGRG